jgi:hypothetical protein
VTRCDEGGPPLEARAARLLYWYPRGWRDRYGAEFTELLIADLADQPHSWRRTAEVSVNGMLARLSRAGGTSDPFHPGVVALSRVLPRDAVVDISRGCHTGPSSPRRSRRR